MRDEIQGQVEKFFSGMTFQKPEDDEENEHPNVSQGGQQDKIDEFTTKIFKIVGAKLASREEDSIFDPVSERGSLNLLSKYNQQYSGLVSQRGKPEKISFSNLTPIDSPKSSID